jgi:CDP-paratose 2-epimerase
VRDVIHVADVVTAFEAYWRSPKPARIYNLGGSRYANVSVLEAVALVEKITGEPVDTSYDAANRVGDHLWWISSNRRFERDYPHWRQTIDLPAVVTHMYETNLERWR